MLRTGTRPDGQTKDSVYSNFDHKLKTSVAAKLDERTCAQHAAWNFCGYVWREGDEWVEEVWQWNSPVEVRRGDDLRKLIASVNDDYGDD